MKDSSKQVNRRFWDKVALVFRIATLPSLLIFTFICFLFIFKQEAFENSSDFVFGVLFLAVIPASAYLIQPMIQKYRNKGRDGQRKLAFITSAIGYIGGLVYGLLFRVNSLLMAVFWSYFITVVFLIFFNKVIKFRASGHAAGTAGPLVMSLIALSKAVLPISLLLYFSSFWASVRLKRHTVSEFITGTFCSVAAVLISVIICK